MSGRRPGLNSRPLHPKTREILAVTVIYVLAHGLMLLNRGLFWDEWMYFRQSRELLVDLGRQLGSTWPDITSWLPFGSPFSIWATRVLMFACFLGVALLTLRLSRRLCHLDAEARIVLASLVAVFPVMSARDAIADFPYPVSLALFMFGWALLDGTIDARGWRAWLPRVTALVAFFLSFRTASLGMFYIVPVVWMIWRSGVTWHRPKEMAFAALRRFDMAIPLLVFWLLRTSAAAPSGLFADYNILTWDSFAAARHLVPQALQQSLVEAFTRMPEVAWWPAVLLGALAAGVALRSATTGEATDVSRRRSVAIWLMTAGTGLALVVLAVYPYLAVGKIPGFTEFLTRHQLLVPFGAALIIVGLVRALTDGAGLPHAVRVGLFTVVIAVCVGTVVGDHLSYQREWYKQIGMIEALRQAPEARAGHAFLFDDRVKRLNINDRAWRRFYEYAGLFEQAFGTHDRFGADVRDYAKRQPGYFTSRYVTAFKLEDCVAVRPEYHVEVKRGSTDLRRSHVLARLMWDEWTGAPDLAASAASTVRLTFRRIE